MRETKLKSCPFCGGENILFKRGWSSEFHNGFYLFCGECRTFQDLCGTKEACIKRWNRRSGDSEVKSVKKGKWINIHSLLCFRISKCSDCEKQLFVIGGPLNYCPKCGAKMKGVAK